MTNPRPPDSPVEPTPDGLLLHVLAFPRAGRSELGEVRAGRLVVMVTAPPEDGKANAAISRLLAKVLGAPPRDIALVSGHTSRAKTFSLHGLDASAVTAALGL